MSLANRETKEVSWSISNRVRDFLNRGVEISKFVFKRNNKPMIPPHPLLLPNINQVK